MDIEPPLHQDQDLSEEQLHKLGLPTHHVHYRAGQPAHQAARQPSDQPAGTELLAPADIQVYTIVGARQLWKSKTIFKISYVMLLPCSLTSIKQKTWK